MPIGFSSGTGQGPWSDQHVGEAWCICIWSLRRAQTPTQPIDPPTSLPPPNRRSPSAHPPSTRHVAPIQPPECLRARARTQAGTHTGACARTLTHTDTPAKSEPRLVSLRRAFSRWVNLGNGLQLQCDAISSKVLARVPSQPCGAFYVALFFAWCVPHGVWCVSHPQLQSHAPPHTRRHT